MLKNDLSIDITVEEGYDVRFQVLENELYGSFLFDLGESTLEYDITLDRPTIYKFIGFLVASLEEV